MRLDRSTKKPPGTKKGILLTLLVIVLFILMLSEVITYIVLTINYNTLAQSASLASTQGATTQAITSSAASLLHASLASSLSTLIKFEGMPGLRGNAYINNTSGMLASLMQNGFLYGHDLTQFTGSSYMGNYSNVINAQFAKSGISFSVSNTNITVYQSNPTAINATYTALITANSLSGTFVYPISVSTSIPINGTMDLSSVQRQTANSASLTGSPIQIYPGYPKATLVSGTDAIAGSNSPFMFVLGTVVTEGSDPSCASIPARLQNKNFILVAENAVAVSQSVCGMGGLIANTVSSATPLTPYLIYNATAASSTENIFNVLQNANGTQVLLNGQGLQTLNTSPIVPAIQNSEYFVSPYLPSYLQEAQNPVSGTRSSPSGGLFTMNLAYKLVYALSDTGGAMNSNVFFTQAKSPWFGGNNYTISFWIYLKPHLNSCDRVLYQLGGTNAYINVYPSSVSCAPGNTNGALLSLGYEDVRSVGVGPFFSQPIPSQTWVYAAVVMNTNTVTWYINGNRGPQYTGLYGGSSAGSSQVILGAAGGESALNGSLQDFQIYGSALNATQVQELYLGGDSGQPVASNVLAWWPLNNNVHDYSGNANNGSVKNAKATIAVGYTRDPIFQHTSLGFNTSPVEGILGCADPSDCSNLSLQQLYISNLGLESVNGIRLNESAALGVSNAVFPIVASFNSTNPGYIEQQNGVSFLEVASQPYSASVWVDPEASTGTIVYEQNSSVGYGDTWFSVVGGTAYAGYWGCSGGGSCGSPSQQCVALGTVPVDQWSNLGLTYNAAGAVFTGYLDGASVATLTGTTRVPSGVSTFPSIGFKGAHNCGASAYLTGYASDFQIYNAILDPSEMQSLYQNNSVSSNAPIYSWALSNDYNGAENRTAETVQGNYGNLYNSNGNECTVANVVSGTCGVEYAP